MFTVNIAYRWSCKQGMTAFSSVSVHPRVNIHAVCAGTLGLSHDAHLQIGFFKTHANNSGIHYHWLPRKQPLASSILSEGLQCTPLTPSRVQLRRLLSLQMESLFPGIVLITHCSHRFFHFLFFFFS